MPSYHVFVDGPADVTPGGIDRLAAAIAEHYGLPVADLRTRIASGRFRVKGNCDGATADMYVRDLTRLGARCSTEEASAQNRANTPLPFPAVKPGASTTLPPPTKPAATKPPSTTKPPAFQSGLSAAFSPGDQAMNLGALEDGALLKLASVDGADEAPAAPPAAFEPPPSAPLPKPKPSAKPQAKEAKPKDEPLDMFAPPEAQGEEFKVELAAEDQAELNARKRASTPPPVAAAPVEATPPAGAGRYARSSLQVENAAVATRAAPHPLANPRVRFALGVVVALVVGFVPATLVASAREKSAYATIDEKIVARQNAADTQDAYATLDTFRAEQLARKYDERRSIAITTLLIWAAIGGLTAYVWFKRIDWTRFET